MARRPPTPSRTPVRGSIQRRSPAPPARGARPEENPPRKPAKPLPGQLGLLDGLATRNAAVTAAIARIEPAPTATPVSPTVARVLSIVKAPPPAPSVPEASAWPKPSAPAAPVVRIAPAAPVKRPVPAATPPAPAPKRAAADANPAAVALALADAFVAAQGAPGAVFSAGLQRNGKDIELTFEKWPEGGPPMISTAGLYSMALSPNSKGFDVFSGGFKKALDAPRSPVGERVLGGIRSAVRTGLREAFGRDFGVRVMLMPMPFVVEASAALERARSQVQEFRERGQKATAIAQRGASILALEQEEIRSGKPARTPAPANPMGPGETEAAELAREIAERLSREAGLQNANWTITERRFPGERLPVMSYELEDYDVAQGPPLADESRLPYLARARTVTADRLSGGVSKALWALFGKIHDEHKARVAPMLGYTNPLGETAGSQVGVERGIYARHLPALHAEIEAFKKGTKTARKESTAAIAVAPGRVVPASAGKATRDAYYDHFEGNKYDTNLRVADIAARLRATIAAAIERGEIPEVRTRVTGADRYVRVHLLSTPMNIPLYDLRAWNMMRDSAGGGRVDRRIPYNPIVEKILGQFRTLVSEYKKTDRSNNGDDYYSSNFYDDVGVESAFESAERKALESGTRDNPLTQLHAGLNTTRLLASSAENAGLSFPELEAALGSLADVHLRGAHPREAQSRISALKAARTVTIGGETNEKRKAVLTRLIDLVLLVGRGEPVGRTPPVEIVDDLPPQIKGLARAIAVLEGRTRDEIALAPQTAMHDYELQIKHGPRKNPAKGRSKSASSGRGKVSHARPARSRR